MVPAYDRLKHSCCWDAVLVVVGLISRCVHVLTPGDLAQVQEAPQSGHHQLHHHLMQCERNLLVIIASLHHERAKYVQRLLPQLHYEIYSNLCGSARRTAGFVVCD